MLSYRDTAEIRIWRHFRWSAFVAMAMKLSNGHIQFHLRFPCPQFRLRQMHWTILSVSIEAKYRVSWRLPNVKTSYQNWPFVISCSSHWLKIEVTAWQKSVFPRCLLALICRAIYLTDWTEVVKWHHAVSHVHDTLSGARTTLFTLIGCWDVLCPWQHGHYC